MSVENMPELPSFVAIGEALTDLIRLEQADQWLSKPGGSTWNVARAIAALEIPSAFAGSISRCCFGDALWQASAAAKLDLRFLQRVEQSPLLAIVAQSQPPNYFFIGDASADLFFAEELLPSGWAKHAAWVHFGGISLAREPLATRLVALAEQLHAQQVRISYDLNFRQLTNAAYLSTFERMCQLADVIKLSDEDIAGLFPNKSPSLVLHSIRAVNPKAWLLYTEGAKGAVLSTPEGAWCGAPPSVQVVDTVGAGDACIAGLIASCLSSPEQSPSAHLAYALAAGSAACQNAGATPPTRAACTALLNLIKMPIRTTISQLLQRPAT